MSRVADGTYSQAAPMPRTRRCRGGPGSRRPSVATSGPKLPGQRRHGRRRPPGAALGGLDDRDEALGARVEAGLVDTPHERPELVRLALHGRAEGVNLVVEAGALDDGDRGFDVLVGDVGG